MSMQSGMSSEDILKSAQLHFNLALAHSAMNQHAESVEQYKRALGAFRRLNRRQDEASGLLRLAEAYRAQSKEEPATKCYRRALQLYDELDDEGGQACVHAERASQLLYMSKEGCVEEAGKELELATLLAEKIENRRTRGGNYELLAHDQAIR